VKKLGLVFLLLLLIAGGLNPAFAKSRSTTPKPEPPPQDLKDRINGIIGRVLGLASVLIYSIGILMIIYFAFKLMTSQSAEAGEQAKNGIKRVAIGLAIYSGVGVIVALVLWLVGGGT